MTQVEIEEEEDRTRNQIADIFVDIFNQAKPLQTTGAVENEEQSKATLTKIKDFCETAQQLYFHLEDLRCETPDENAAWNG